MSALFELKRNWKNRFLLSSFIIFISSFFLTACTSTQVDAIDLNKEKAIDIYLMPYEGFDIHIAKKAAEMLSQDLKLNVHVGETVPMPHHTFNIVRNQYEAKFILEQIKQKSFDVKNTKYDTLYIGLLDGSIYPEGEHLNYVFSMSSSDRTAIVANYEMMLGVSPILYYKRLYKILKRNIGKAYYRYPPSKNPKSIMLEPIIGTMDLDNLHFLYDNEIE